MSFANYRTIYLEILLELCDLTRNVALDGEVCWHADYLCRASKLYSFRGTASAGAIATEARILDVFSGGVRKMSPSLLTVVLLEFESNGLIAAYNGSEPPSTLIADGFSRPDRHMPEIVSVSIRKRMVESGKLVDETTSFVFVGYRIPSDVHELTPQLPLALTKETVSLNRLRDRTMLIRHQTERVPIRQREAERHNR